MRTTQRFPKVVTLLCAVSLSFAVAACGDDDDDDDDVIMYDAAPPIDADTTPDATPDYDAEPPQSTRDGVVSVVDMILMDSDAVEANWYSGALASITYVIQPAVTDPQFDNMVPPGVGCSATFYDIGGGVLPPDTLDEGIVTIEGDGVVHALGVCDHDGDDAYNCLTGGGAIAAGDSVTVGATPAGTALLSITGSAFGVADVGRVISAGGYDDATNNGAFPIVSLGAAPPTTLIVVGNPAAVTGVSTAGGAYGVVAGAGPTPAQVPFLDSAAGMVDISKEAGTETEAIAVTQVTPGGLGYRPDDATVTIMRTLPIDSTTDLDFACGGAGGTCGTATGTIISLTVTNGTLGANPFDLPVGANIVSVSCRAFGDTVTVPVAVLDLIETMSPAPTRARTTIFRANFALAGDADGTNQTGMVSGYGYTKFTDL